MYDFDLSNPTSWRNFNAPHLNPSIPTELLKIGGMNRKGQPRLRVIWGGKEQIHYQGDDVNPPGYYLKYHLCFTPPVLAAYEYRDQLTGEKQRVSTHVALPDDVVVQPLYRQEEIGKPRWIIEIWRDAGDCNGFFKDEGYYHLLTVQKEPIDSFTGMGPYREIDRDVLEVLKGMIHFMENTTEAQREAMRSADDERAKDLKQKRDHEIWEDFEDNVEKLVKDKSL